MAESQQQHRVVVVLAVAVVLVALAPILPPDSRWGVQASPVVSEEQLAKAAKMVRGVCQPKTGATDEQLGKLAAGVINDEKEVKCYISCLMSTTKTLKNGRIDPKMVKMQAEKMMPPDKRDSTLASLDVCKDATGADACEVAYNYLTCAQNFNPEKFFFPV